MANEIQLDILTFKMNLAKNLDNLHLRRCVVAEWSRRVAFDPVSLANPSSNPGRHVYRDSRSVHPLARWHKFICHVPDDDLGRRNGR